MRRCCFFLLVLFSNISSIAQEENEIINMFGLSDSSGNNYLIYEDVKNVWYYPVGKRINVINIEENIDSVIIEEDGWWQHDFGTNYISDYALFDWNPNNIVYVQIRGMFGINAVYNKAAKTEFFLEARGSEKLLISQTKPNVVHLTTEYPGGYATSLDRGKTWPVIDSLSHDYRPITIPFNLFSLYPNTDSTMFGIDSLGNLLKSYDTGLTSEIVEESGNWSFLRKNFYYDKDGIHIYAVTKKDDHYFLYVSNNYGNKGSWNQLENSLSKISLSVDNKVSGKFYFSTRNFIYQSRDSGQTFEILNNLDYDIVGLDNVPNTDTIYAATKFAIWQITPKSITPIKQVISHKSVSYYPLQVGNKWYYDVKYVPGWSTTEFNYKLTKEVIKDTILSNDKTYLQIKELRSDTNLVRYSYERIDSLSGKIYQFSEFVTNNEFIQFDLISPINRPFITSIEFFGQQTTELMYLTEQGQEDIFNSQLTNIGYRNYVSNSNNNSYGVSHKLNENIGRSYFKKYFIDGFDEIHILKAAYINGIKYGDTTLVGINDELISQIPTAFSLSQNYPNPFNPTTTIEYYVPSSSVILSAAKNLQDFSSQSSPNNGAPQNDNYNISLKVYDILGREVKNLVNQPQNPGKYSVQFNAENLSSGIYYYQLTAGSFIQTKKMILLK